MERENGIAKEQNRRRSDDGEEFKLVGYTRFVRTNPRSDRFQVLGFHHIEFWCGDATNTAGRFSFALGAPISARSDLSTGNTSHSSILLRSGDLRFLFSAPYAGSSPSPIIPSFSGDLCRRFFAAHGLAVRAIAVRVADAAAAFESSVHHGARPSSPPADLGFGFSLAEVEIYGDVVLRYINHPDIPSAFFLPGFEEVTSAINGEIDCDLGIRRLDHAVGNVPELGPVAAYVARFTGFHEFAEFTAEDVGTAESGLNSVVLADNDERVLIPMNEPVAGTARRSQIQTYLDYHGGPGVQHLALASDDVLRTLREMRHRSAAGGFEFMAPPPETYYKNLAKRAGDVLTPEQIEECEELGVLVDRDDQGVLLQIFTKPIGDRPTIFIEIIQRIGCMMKDEEGKEYQKGGCGGFGKGNFSELFKSIEEYEKTLEAKQAGKITLIGRKMRPLWLKPKTSRRRATHAMYRKTLLLAYQSMGVVYGDLSVSPIYVYKNSFSGKLRFHEEDDEVLGVLSLVFWSLTLIPLGKYVLFVLAADDDGEGGTFALYSLLCRNSKIGVFDQTPSVQEQVRTMDTETKTSSLIKNFFEKHQSSRIVLFLLVLLGTSMVVGDGVLTPAMSVLAAVSGIKVKAPNLHENITVLISCIILLILFTLQHRGTHRVGFLFAPVLLAWLGCIGAVGIYNIIKWNPRVIYAVSPYYIFNFFKIAGKDGWSSLRGVVLCITGAEAMFADLGHFSRLSIKMAFVASVYPCLVLAYMGEAAYLTKNKQVLGQSFYKSIPESIFWPVFIIATLATVVASQAVISATFSVVGQCRALGCFPRVKIQHTSSFIHGQIYIPEINWILMMLCLGVTIGFRDTDTIGNAYGIPVIIVMLVTTLLMFLIITVVWKKTILLAILFVVSFGSLETIYLSACLAKIHNGGWLPLVFSFITLFAMAIWRYGSSKKRAFELQNKVNVDQLLCLSRELGLVRVPGIVLFYTGLDADVPPMFGHFLANFPAIHRVCIFVSFKTITVPKVRHEERYMVGRVGPPEHRIYRCVVRYGYKDGGRDEHEFESQIIMKLAEFLQAAAAPPPESIAGDGEEALSLVGMSSDVVEMEEMKEEAKELMKEKENGVANMMGRTTVMARASSSLLKKMAIDGVYGFLSRNSRRPAAAMGIPHASLIQVGMVYKV